MGAKVQAIKFETTNKARIRGKVGHSRTGACNGKGKCYHGLKPRVGKPHTHS